MAVVGGGSPERDYHFPLEEGNSRLARVTVEPGHLRNECGSRDGRRPGCLVVLGILPFGYRLCREVPMDAECPRESPVSACRALRGSGQSEVC